MPDIRCPKCQRVLTYERAADLPWFPFCCERCQMVDLGKWLNEEHRLSRPLEGTESADTPADNG